MSMSMPISVLIQNMSELKPVMCYNAPELQYVAGFCSHTLLYHITTINTETYRYLSHCI